MNKREEKKVSGACDYVFIMGIITGLFCGYVIWGLY